MGHIRLMEKDMEAANLGLKGLGVGGRVRVWRCGF